MGDMNLPLDYDIIELTFILKSIGFHLKSFEFSKSDSAGNKEIQVDLTCHASGLKTTFILSSDQCTCPPKPLENNNTFWEVQGKSPSTPTKKVIKETSCNILPEINKKTIGLGRSTLLMLLQHYRNDLGQQQNIIAAKQIPKSITAQLNEIANNATEVSPNSQFPQKQTNENRSYSSTPLNTNAAGPQTISHTSSAANIPKIKLEIFDEPELLNGNTERVQNTHISPSFTPSKTGVVFPSPQLNNKESDRDVYIIESISKARKELDAALLHLKCNITRDLSECSVLKQTPEPAKSQSIAGQQFKGITRRRASIGSSEGMRSRSIERDQFQFQKPQNKGLSNGILSAGKLMKNSVNKSKLPDTPRPHVDLKSTVDKGIAKSKMLRSATSGSLKGPTTTNAKPQLAKQKSAIPLKNK